jgi:hypothetical protein
MNSILKDVINITNCNYPTVAGPTEIRSRQIRQNFYFINANINNSKSHGLLSNNYFKTQKSNNHVQTLVSLVDVQLPSINTWFLVCLLKLV